MDNEIIEQLFLSLNNATKDQGSQVFSEMHKTLAVPISKDNFFSILDIDENDCRRKACFIDGGNLEIFTAPNFSVQMIRIYYTIYSNNKRVFSDRKEFFVLIKSVIRNGKLFYEAESFGKSPVGKLSFYAYDQELRTGVSKLQISSLGGLVRRLCEIRIIEECANHLDEGDFVVMDGDLQEKTQLEHNFFESVNRLCDSKKIIIAAIAKTNSLLTDSGNAFSTLLLEHCNEGEWIYYPLVTEDANRYSLKRCMFRLHEKSKHVFKVEIVSSVDEIKVLANILKKNSVDPVFLGYPYGLIEADRFARVTKEELEYLRTKLLAASERGFKSMNKYFNLMNAHEILDNIG